MIYKAPSKINLALDILSREENGFHIIQTVYQTVSLSDIISFEKNKNWDINFTGEDADLISADDNTVTKSVRLLEERYKIKNRYKISVNKKIPAGAGLGGGSSDAACVIKAINDIESLSITPAEMRDLAAEIGSDVPHFIENGTSLGSHYGEKISPLPGLDYIPEWSKLYEILVIPPRNKRKKTAEKYAEVDIKLTGKNIAKTDALINALKGNDTEEVIKTMHNDFEIFAGPEFDETKKILLKEGALRALLCGSGTAIFAVSSNPFDAASLSRELPNQRILNLNR